MRAFRKPRIDGRNVQDRYQLAAVIKDRCAGTAKADVSCTKVLILMNSNGALFGNAGADAVGPLGLFGPHAAEPRSPLLELVGFCLRAAMIDCNTFVITKEDDVSCLPHN